MVPSTRLPYFFRGFAQFGHRVGMTKVNSNHEPRPRCDELACPGERGYAEMIIERVGSLLVRICKEHFFEILLRVRRQLREGIQVSFKARRSRTSGLRDKLAALTGIFDQLAIRSSPLLQIK